MLKKILLKLIKIYQKTISPDHSLMFKSRFPQGYCRFQPTCSQYASQAISKYGLIKGTVMGSWRILRCNPYSRGGDDPVK